jgi:hypothetical protein
MIYPALDIGRTITAKAADHAVFEGNGPAVDGFGPVVVTDAAQDGSVAMRILDADGALLSAPGPDSGLVIGDDPFGFWTVAADDLPSDVLPAASTNARASETLPMVVSAGAVLVTRLLGWRLIAPPRQHPPKTKRYKNGSPRSRQDDDAEGVRYVLRYIGASMTPQFLKRRKKSRRKGRTRSGRVADDRVTAGDVTRAIADSIWPRGRRRRRRRASVRSATGVSR